MRAAFCVLWEVMVADARAEALDLHARATFTKDGDTVLGTRARLDQLSEPPPDEVAERRQTRLAQSSAGLALAFKAGFVEVG